VLEEVLERDGHALEEPETEPGTARPVQVPDAGGVLRVSRAGRHPCCFGGLAEATPRLIQGHYLIASGA
jgi:hypothetical protein